MQLLHNNFQAGKTMVPCGSRVVAYRVDSQLTTNDGAVLQACLQLLLLVYTTYISCYYEQLIHKC